ncbi:hypothetical protein ACETRX_07180 [Labrys portucalensis]|uniref:DUF4175 domain-containing protein n=1 Tax=Labrys neptuniae TaxID=376174 RepID=A0ABV6ZB23_9HYPH|nr:hypothetical protein [Labrys neptuniae]MDT3379378.1 hypothetical protein [Labrys neptuniae]
MFVIWPVIVAMVLGVVCGTFVPVLAFTIIALIASIGSALIIWMAGFGLGTALIDMVAIAIALQVGYVFGILVLLAVSKLAPKLRPGLVRRYEHEHDSSRP